MKLSQLIKIEFMKVRRSRIIPLLLIAPLLVVISGVGNLSTYFTAEYTNAWQAMFIQSALAFAYYLLPFQMIVVCIMLQGVESRNHGILKMLVMPVNTKKLSLSKFIVLSTYLLAEMLIFFGLFLIAGIIATRAYGINETMPIGYLSWWCIKLYLTMMPCLALMWTFTSMIRHTLISVGLNLLLVIPGILAANTPMWVVYPYCYSGYMVSRSLYDFTVEGSHLPFDFRLFIPCAAAIFICALTLSVLCYGKKYRS